MLPEDVRSIVLSSCLHDDGIKMKVYVAVVMPDHVHVIFTPLVNTRLPLEFIHSPKSWAR